MFSHYIAVGDSATDRVAVFEAVSGTLASGQHRVLSWRLRVAVERWPGAGVTGIAALSGMPLRLILTEKQLASVSLLSVDEGVEQLLVGNPNTVRHPERGPLASGRSDGYSASTCGQDISAIWGVAVLRHRRGVVLSESDTDRLRLLSSRSLPWIHPSPNNQTAANSSSIRACSADGDAVAAEECVLLQPPPPAQARRGSAGSEHLHLNGSCAPSSAGTVGVSPSVPRCV